MLTDDDIAAIKSILLHYIIDRIETKNENGQLIDIIHDKPKKDKFFNGDKLAHIFGVNIGRISEIKASCKKNLSDKDKKNELVLRAYNIKEMRTDEADYYISNKFQIHDNIGSTITSFERSLQSQMGTMRKDLEEKIEQVKNPLNNEEIKKHVNHIISEKIDKIISEDIVQKVGEETLKVASDFSIKQEISGFIKDKYNVSSERYGVYGKNSEKEALLYRYVGIGFCIAGVVVPAIILCIILIGQYPNYEHWERIFMGFPLTITLEAIGLLLLTLSQKATERMRAFSVENCNLDLQSAGYLSAIQAGDMKKIVSLMEVLAKSERHYILKKDERTIEESHNKSHLEFMKNVTDALKPIINQKQ